jgi:hypothetical protein
MTAGLCGKAYPVLQTLAVLKLPKYLPKWWYHFTFPPASNESSCCPMTSSAFGVVNILDFSYLMGVVLIYNFSMVYNMRHIFIYLFSTCLSSLVIQPFRSLAYFILFYFL